MDSVELFAGAGGLAMGISNVGFKHRAVVECDSNACETLKRNKAKKIAKLKDWPIYEVDVSEYDFSSIKRIDLLAGGPPCQPFSLGGKHKGHQDRRNMFPEMIRAVRELEPKAVLVENVKGFLRKSFSTYYEYILFQLTYPELQTKNNEPWKEHLARLEKHHTRKRLGGGLQYNVVFQLLNAADYGIPQKRERLFIVAFRSDLNVEWSFPKVTHSRDAMLADQWLTGYYWERHGISKRKRPKIPDKALTKLRRLEIDRRPWQTVRDAIGDLPDPERMPKKAARFLNHAFNPGARSYPGHTGSPIDEPAKTLKAGVHGVPGGENTLTFHDGSVRYFTIREAARLQTFPDEYEIKGAWSEAMKQLGNAVPVALAEMLAHEIKKCLLRI